MLALDFKNKGMLKADYLKEHGGWTANCLVYVCKNILGHDIVVMGGDTVFVVRETVSTSAVLKKTINDNSAIFEKGHMDTIFPGFATTTS